VTGSPVLHVHALKDDRAGFWAVTVQASWRVIFKFLELALGKSAESWLAAQAAYDVWQLEVKRESLGVHKLAA
jgi:hypothetical protein